MAGKPLEGAVILELGQVIAGTYGGTILADLGAEVIKVEPLRGDAARNPGIANMRGESAIHLFMNRGKKSVALNLKDPDGLAVFERMVESADAVIDNFRPGVMDRLKIGHESLAEINPDIVTASITGFGSYGPAKDRPAFDLVIQAISGHLYITGEPDGPPSRVGIPLADMAGGLFACISVLAGLCGRDKFSNGGQSVDVGMLDSLVSMLGYDALYHLNTGEAVERQGTEHAHMVPWRAFAVKDGHIVIAAREEKFWVSLCNAIERPDLIDHPLSHDNRTRVVNRDFVSQELESVFLTRTKDEWIALLTEYDIPSAPVNDFEQVFADPQVVGRGIVRTYEHPTLGPIRYTASPMQSPMWEFPNRHAPMLGEHTSEILTGRLGYSSDEVDDLVAREVVVTWAEGDVAP